MKPTYPTELIGTYFLVLTVGLTVTAGTPFAPLAIGAALMVMVYMGGHVSGAHYNPAVTLAVWMRGKLPGRDVVPYWVAQLLGAILAAITVRAVAGKTFAPVWIYIVGPLGGATLAALFFRVQNPEPVPGRAIPAAPPHEPSIVEGDYTAPRPGSSGSAAAAH